MPKIKLQPLSREEWADLGTWSAQFQSRDYPGCTQRLEAIMDSEDWPATLARVSATAGVFVKRILGGAPSADAGQLLHHIAGPAIQSWCADMDVLTPDEEVLEYLTAGKPVSGQGEKSDRAIFIALGAALSFYREDLFDEVTSVMTQAIGMANAQ